MAVTAAAPTHRTRRISTWHLIAALGALLLMLGAVGCRTSNPELRHRGHIAQQSGNYERARGLYSQAVRQRPTDMQAQFGLGRAHLALDQPRQAQLALEEALTLAEPGDELRPKILDHLAEALYQQERFDRLHAFLQGTLSPEASVRDYLRQANYLSKMGDVDSAKVAYRKAAHFASEDNPEPYIALADFYERINDVPNAIKALRWAYYVDSENDDVAQRLRQHGIVPGPTVGEKPDKPALLQ